MLRAYVGFEVSNDRPDILEGRISEGFMVEGLSDCRMRIGMEGAHPTEVIGGAFVANESIEVYAFHSFPPETLIQELPTNFQGSLRRFGSSAVNLE